MLLLIFRCQNYWIVRYHPQTNVTVFGKGSVNVETCNRSGCKGEIFAESVVKPESFHLKIHPIMIWKIRFYSHNCFRNNLERYVILFPRISHLTFIFNLLSWFIRDFHRKYITTVYKHIIFIQIHVFKSLYFCLTFSFISISRIFLEIA